ncbi:hypothetical protein PBI_DUKE13_233 [Mycobacterium phage Duke13]|uniref:Uncharacterized protein n=1 Tax=Mycobacterium phage Duke13 TaxID=2499038 RepID=A0A3S9UB97_9CAUD|nr:hypothetical protein PBI_DUKE13_233 [Mycobacterium phage Duke13]
MDSIGRALDKAVNSGKATFSGLLITVGASAAVWAMLALIVWVLS